MKKLIALVVLAAAPVLFAQEKVSVNKVSEVKQTEEASKAEVKATASKAEVKATHAKGGTSLQSARATENKTSTAAIKEEKAK